MAEWTNERQREPEAHLGDVTRDRGDDSTADADPEALRADIRNTRDRVGDTLEQLGERLNPTHLKEQVREQVLDNVTQIKEHVRETIRDATIGRVEHMAQQATDRVNATRQSMADTIRDNPIPAAMVGLGLGWLFMNRQRSSGSDASRGGARFGSGMYGYPAGRPAYGASGYGSQSYGGQSYGQEAGPIDQARDRVSDIGHTVRDSAGQLADRAQQAAGAVADRAQDVASTVADQTRTQARRVEDRFHESPLAVGAATLALGLAAGLSLPATHREVELMGDARDRLVDRAKDVAHDTTDKVQHVADRVLHEAQSATGAGSAPQPTAGRAPAASPAPTPPAPPAAPTFGTGMPPNTQGQR